MKIIVMKKNKPNLQYQTRFKIQNFWVPLPFSLEIENILR